MILYAHYAHAFDLNNAGEWAQLFTPDGVFRLEGYGEVVVRGALIEFVLSRNGSTPEISHHTTNVVAVGTSEGADGRAYAFALRIDEENIRIRNVGGYVDKLVMHEGKWRFSLRHFSSWLVPGLVDASIATRNSDQ